MIRIYSLGSGSKGNCILVDNGKNRVLIDAGLTYACISKKLRELSLDLRDVDGVFITHEHNDHIKGLEELAAVLPVYSHPLTLDAIAYKCHIPYNNLMELETGISIGTLDVTPFPVSHDAVHPYGYSISDWETKFTYLTDSGFISTGALGILRGSDEVMLESNHDMDMLALGAYPPYLKKRISGCNGHLSNSECALTVADLLANGTSKVMLAHLSEQNNLPELAYWTTKNFLRDKGVEDASYVLKVATQRDTVLLG